MIRLLMAAALIAGGTTFAMAQGAGGGTGGGSSGGAASGGTSGAGGGTGTMRRDDNPAARPGVSASGGIACNGNVCWHTTERYDYPASSGVIVREPGWTPGP